MSSGVLTVLSDLKPVADANSADAWKRVDEIEDELMKLEQVRPPVHHVFTPGLYCREVFLPQGCLFTTRIHLTEHPFVISKGAVAIWQPETGWVKLSAPHTGITKPGTRRVLYAIEDTIFSTFHVTNETDPDVIGRQITSCDGKFSELGLAAQLPLDHVLRISLSV